MAIQTLDQKRAAHAYDAVEAAKKLPEDQKKKYGVHARKLPTRIIASGLGQALAFLVAKDYCPTLLESLSHWCLRKAEKEKAAANELLLAIIKGNSEDLRRHTAEALAYLQWLVRFVEAAGMKAEE
jgi:CRISPR type III-B/RAMP module-associated protein Cmr5